MHKLTVLWLGVILGLTSPLWGQSIDGTTDPSIKISNVVQAPTSNVDILKQSLKKNSPFAGPAKAPKVPTVPKPVVREMAQEQVAVKNEQQPDVKDTQKPAVTVAVSEEKPAEKTSNPAEKQPATAPAVVAAEPVQQPVAAAQPQPIAVPVPTTNNVKEVPQPALTPRKQPVAPAGPRRTRKGRRPRIQTAPVSRQPATSAPSEIIEQTPEDSEEDAPDAEQEYAVKMLGKAKQKSLQGRSVPPSAAKNKPGKVPNAKKKFNPNAFRPGVTWIASKSDHFDIYTQKPNGKIGSANLSLAFETAYATLRRFIPWMMSDRVRVFVYQDQDSYLRYEPEAKIWTRAIAYPTRGEIVVYDEPGHTQELKETFAHELTHIFTQQFFDKHNTGRIMTPTWLDEGLAVLVQDQMFAGKEGGPWNNDYRTLRFERDPKTQVASFSSSKMFRGFEPKPFVPISQRQDPVGPRRGKTVRLKAFEDFMQEGSLEAAEGQGDLEHWYLQAYLMVRFLLNPGGGSSPSNRMQFEQLTGLIANGEAVRDPSTGFLVRDSRGKQVYEPYDVEKALNRAYRYRDVAAFEEAFWKWLNK